MAGKSQKPKTRGNESNGRNTSTGSQAFHGVAAPDKILKSRVKKDLLLNSRVPFPVEGEEDPPPDPSHQVSVGVRHAAFGSLSEYPRGSAHPDTRPKAMLALSFRSYYGQKEDHSDLEKCYEIAVWQTTRVKNERVSTKLQSFFFTSNDIEASIRMYRETRLIEIFMKYPLLSKRPDPRDLFGAFTLDSSTPERGKQCSAFWAKVRRACEVMSLQQLYYANMRRNAVDISMVTGPPVVQTRSRTRPGLTAHATKVAGMAEEVTRDDTVEPLRMPIPNGEGGDWVFSGHLKNQAFFDLIEHFGIGYDRNGNQSVDETSEKLTAMGKKKAKAPSRREKREERVGRENLDNPL